MKEQIRSCAARLREPMVSFAQKIIRLPSDTGHEKAVADAILEELQKLGYDEAYRDRTGNIIGILKGDGTGSSILFNCHMDQVDPGDLSAWQYEPFGGEIAEGCVHGRGASDTKGTIATHVYLGALVRELKLPLKGDLVFTFVVEEEPGDMWGALRMCQDCFQDRKFDLAISGESTGMDIAIGHRGRLEVQVISRGKNSHSSAPWNGINAVSKMAPMIVKIDEMAKQLPTDGTFQSSLSIINVECTPGFNCVVPDSCTVNIDYRYNSQENAETILADFRRLADEVEAADPETRLELRVRELEHTSYTGVHEFARLDKPYFITDINHPLIQKTIGALHEMDQQPKTYFWDYGTDAAYIATVMGVPTIGYSPAEEIYCHGPRDRIRIGLMEKALEGYGMICARVACGL